MMNPPLQRKGATHLHLLLSRTVQFTFYTGKRKFLFCSNDSLHISFLVLNAIKFFLYIFSANICYLIPCLSDCVNGIKNILFFGGLTCVGPKWKKLICIPVKCKTPVSCFDHFLLVCYKLTLSLHWYDVCVMSSWWVTLLDGAILTEILQGRLASITAWIIV